MVTLKVAKEVIAGAAELVAAEAVVVLVTAEADLEVELGHDAVVLQALPLAAGVDHSRVDGFLDNCTPDACEYNSSDPSAGSAEVKLCVHSKDSEALLLICWMFS